MDIEKLMEFAVQRHLVGDLDAAGTAYSTVLTANPQHAHAWNLSGVLAHQTGRHAEGVEYLRHAIAIQDDVPEYHANLATALLDSGQPVEAAISAGRCIGLDPLHKLAWNILGNAQHQFGDPEQSVMCFRRAIAIDANHVDAWVNLGRLYRETADLEQAEACTRRALEIDPNNSHALNNFGAIRKSQKRMDEAIAYFQRADALGEASSVVAVNLGVSFQECGRLHEAEAAFQLALERDPNNANAWNSAGTYYQATGDVPQARQCFLNAVRLNPQHVAAASNYLFGLNLATDIDRAGVFEEHCEWGRQAATGRTANVGCRSTSDADRKLRIGYVSPDLRSHPMVGFFEPILRSHDREAFEIVCYAEVASPDETTHRLKSMADDWRVTCGRNADDVRTLIEADGIDILVDLAGHTANNRLDVFARAAAPVQVSMLGYLNTTGLTTMDYYVTDQVRDPPHDDGYYTEAVVRLPGGGCCWDPPARATAVMPPPSLRNGYVTYGSMHRPNKFTDQTIRLWSRILDRTAGSRLLIFHNSLGGSPELQGHLLRRFEAAGLAKERIDIAWDPSGEYLNAYDAMDILLEAVPWSSGTTALESLWMGVPIPTICGDRPVGRATVSALHRLHLDDLIAANEADYIEIVVGLANDAARRQTLRAELRDRMQSTICNADQFVQQLEAAYRTMCKEAQHAA